MLLDRFYLYGALGARIVSGATSLLVLTWFLPVREYGLFVTVMTWGQLLGILSNYGLQTQLLRDVAAQPDAAGELVTISVRLKNLLAIVVTLPVAALYLVRPHGGWVTTFEVAAIYLSGMSYSYSDLLSQSLRSLGRYGVDFVVTALGYLGYLAVLGACYALAHDLSEVVWAVMSFRLLHVALSLGAVARLVELGNLVSGDGRRLLRHLRESTGLGIDSTLTSLTSQVDVILVSWVAGLSAVAGYQVISRIVGYTLMPAQILLGLYLPRLASKQNESRVAVLRRMRIELCACAALSSLAVLAAGLFYPYFFRADLSYDMMVWAGFAAFTALKYVSSVEGTVLIVTRQVGTRIVAQVANTLVIVGGIPLMVAWAGVQWAPWVLCAASALTLLVYRTTSPRTLRELRCDRSPKEPIQSC